MRSEVHKEGQIVGLSILCTTKRTYTPYKEKEKGRRERKKEQAE
jgi:hypothetical protein